MEYSRIQKIIYWLKCKKHFPDIQQSFKYNEKQSGSIMILLPDTDIAFDFSELILNQATSEIKDKMVFLVKDSLAKFYSEKLQKYSKLYSYKDVDSLGLPNEWFIDEIKKPRWSKFGTKGKLKSFELNSTIDNFYMTCSISRSSETMVMCVDQLNRKKLVAE